MESRSPISKWGSDSAISVCRQSCSIMSKLAQPIAAGRFNHEEDPDFLPRRTRRARRFFKYYLRAHRVHRGKKSGSSSWLNSLLTKTANRELRALCMPGHQQRTVSPKSKPLLQECLSL